MFPNDKKNLKGAEILNKLGKKLATTLISKAVEA